MGLGRGSAMVATVLMGLFLLHCQKAHAATYTVGDNSGWTFNVQNWPKGKKFKAGDILAFNYDPSFHNVVAVNKAGYDSCKVPSGSKVFRSGRDKIKLAKGQNFFLCSVPGHCQPGGMKIAVPAV